MFKVVPDQLRISEGWVRCGHCAEVFDAYRQMQPPQALDAVAGGIEAEQHAVAGVVATGTVPEAVVAADPLVGPPGGRREPTEEGDARSSVPSPSDAPAGTGMEGAPAADPVDYHFLIAPESADPDAPSAMPVDPVAATVGGDVSFLRDGRRKAFWLGPWVRGVLVLLLLALLVLLTLQVLIHQRDRLAVMEPRLKPWLLALCEPLQCRVAPLRQIESIVIDSSTFSRADAETFRLRFTLHNNADLELASPALEVTLTDAQDQPVVRRILLPADLGAPPALAALGEWSAAVHVGVDANGGAARIAGYRLIAFYP
jgi:predicted Zn finger-like uncharacterized protein